MSVLKAISEPTHFRSKLQLEIHDLAEELHDAHDMMLPGPTILAIVNDIAVAFEGLFSAGPEQSSNVAEARDDYLVLIARFAEEIRSNNGEVPEEFFALLDTDPLAQIRLAA